MDAGIGLFLLLAIFICSLKLSQIYKLLIHIGMMISENGMRDYFHGKYYNKNGYNTDNNPK